MRGLCFGMAGSILGVVESLADASGGEFVAEGDGRIAGAALVGAVESIRRAPNPGLAPCVVAWKVDKMPLIGSWRRV